MATQFVLPRTSQLKPTLPTQLNQLRWIGASSLTILIALYIVGAVSHGSLRHEIQTLPLWCPILLGFNRKDLARWCALPCLGFWLFCMTLIWLFLLGWSNIISGQFSPIEIAMTVIVGAASFAGLASSIRRIRWSTAGFLLAILFAILQVAAFRISMLPAIAHQ
jgi:hypothetical protein